MGPLNLIQSISAILLIISIVLQGRGAGLGSSWGGAGEFYGTRRGVEKMLFRFTIILAALFVVVSISSLIF